jgi:hypothetical protein
MNPFISFCLYVAARVFVQYLKSRPDDDQTADSLRFLLTAMKALKVKNPLTESFLVQLDVDLESLGLRNPKFRSLAQGLANMDIPGNSAYANRKQTGPDGRIDQCSFLKIVDDVEEPTSALDSLWTASNTVTDNSRVHPVAMHGILEGLSQNNNVFEPARNLNSNMGVYGQSDSSNNIDLDMSSDQNHSDRPTPSTSTGSNLQPGQRQTGQTHSGRSSFDASPASSHQPPENSGAANAFFNHTPDFSTLGASSGMTPGSNTFGLPDTPGGRDFAVPSGWEMSNQGLTPVGEGVFQQLMGMGPMDLQWDG